MADDATFLNHNPFDPPKPKTSGAMGIALIIAIAAHAIVGYIIYKKKFELKIRSLLGRRHRRADDQAGGQAAPASAASAAEHAAAAATQAAAASSGERAVGSAYDSASAGSPG